MSTSTNGRERRSRGATRRTPLAATVASAFALLASSAGAAADSDALAGVPVPPGATSRAIATDIVQNGRNTSIATLRTTASLDDTLAFYRDSWSPTPEDPGHREERLGEWSVLSRIEGRALLTVEVRDGAAGPEGRLSAMALDMTPAGVQPPPPMPAGGQLVSSTTARDGATLAMTSIVTSTARAGEVVGFYRDRLARDGWTLVSDRVHDGSPVLLLDRRGAHAEVVVTDVDGRSVVVFNEVRLDG